MSSNEFALVYLINYRKIMIKYLLIWPRLIRSTLTLKCQSGDKIMKVVIN